MRWILDGKKSHKENVMPSKNSSKRQNVKNTEQQSIHVVIICAVSSADID